MCKPPILNSMNIEQSLGMRVVATARKYPAAIALSCDGNSYSYDHLVCGALKLASHLINNEIVNCNIGILTQKTFSAYIGVLASLFAGCTFVPLNPKQPLKRVESAIRQADISVLFCDRSETFDLETLLQSVCVKHVIYPEEVLNTARQMAEPVLSGFADIAYIMFTSGSTGEPKGVMVTHANICSHVDNMTALYGFSSEDRLSQTFDLSFDPSVSDMFCAWCNGSCLCVLPPAETYCAVDFIQREKITFWASVPTLASFMIRLGKLKAGLFPELKYSTFCGEPLPQSIADQWQLAAPNSTVENLYGPTEATVYVTRHVYENIEHLRDYSNKIVPIGLPLPNQKAVIVDEKLNPLPDGSVGELCVSGSQVTLGYLNDVAKTDKMFVFMPWETDKRNRWYRTGDLALVNEYSNIECLGRIDSQIKIAGQRMELGEIESVLRDITNVAEVAAVPVLYSQGVPQGIAAFIGKDITKDEIEIIKMACKSRLLSAFVPKAIFSLELLPINTSGKVDRTKLKEMATALLRQ